MTNTKIVRALTFALAIPAFAITAYADLYASYDPSNPSVTFPTRLTAETDIAGQNIWGAEFSPTASGQVTSLIAAIAVENLQPPGGPATFQFNLFAGPVVDPFNDTPIDTFSQVVNSPGAAIQSITFSSTDHPVLTAGDTYWLYMGTSPGEEQPLDWGVPSITGVTGTIDDASIIFPGGGGTNHNFTTTTQPAFVIEGGSTAATPEPSYSVLVGFGIALLFLLRLGAKRKSRILA